MKNSTKKFEKYHVPDTSLKHLPPSKCYLVLTGRAGHGVVEGRGGECFTGEVGGEEKERGQSCWNELPREGGKGMGWGE